MVRGWIMALAVGCGPQSDEPSDTGSAQQACMQAETPADQDRALRLRNAADHPIWLYGLHCVSPFAIEGPDGDVTPSIYGQCTSCESALADGCEWWCEDHCDGIAIRVEPGGVFERVWSRRLWETITLDCEGCDATCDVAELAPDGDYVARARVFASCTPPPRPQPGLPACDCTPDANGSCEMFLPYATFADDFALEATFAWPGTDAVELVFP
jgi:hypothetical protein